MKKSLCKWLLFATVFVSLSSCGLGQYGACFSRCGGNVAKTFGAPADPNRGALWGDAIHGRTEKYTIGGFAKLERIGEPPSTQKVSARTYVADISEEEAQGSKWYTATFGQDYIDPLTNMPRKGRITFDAPLLPPGIYKLTSQASYVEKLTLSGEYYPFRSKPQSTTIVVEAGKWSILGHEVKIDESTQPMTVAVHFWQSGKDALPRLRSGGFYSFNPDFVIADPLPK